MLSDMSVPMALLGLLDREPSHGYDLKRDYDTYFGRGRPLPYGQVYATLSRLARDGKAIVGEAEPGARPADRSVREGRPVADARSPGRGVPGRPARRTPVPDARAHRPQTQGNPD